MGLFDSVLGPSFLGLTGSDKTTTQKQTLDPTTQALNQFRYNSLADMYGGIGGLQNQLQNYGSLGYVGEGTQNALTRATNAATTPGLSSNDWYNQANTGLNYGNQANAMDQYYSQFGQGLNQYANSAYGAQGTALNQGL